MVRKDTLEPYEDLRVLVVESNPADAELILHALKEAGFAFTSAIVETKEGYFKSLADFIPDIILADYDLPSFSGLEALEIRKEICPHTPFILVTGTIAEKRATEVLTCGATDYVSKRNLSRLVPAFSRALFESNELRSKDRRYAEAVLNESERRYRNLVFSSPDAIIVHLHGKILFANPAAVVLFGATCEEHLKKYQLQELVPPKELAIATERSNKALQGESQPPRDGQMIRLDGEIIPVEITSSHVEFEGVSAVQVLYRNVSERIKADEEFRQWSALRETAYKELDAFTYSISHDLKGPLRALDGFTKMILKDYGSSMDPELLRRFNVIIESANMMDQMIDALLSLSRVGRKGISLSQVDIGQIIQGAWDELKALNPERKIDFHLGETHIVYCDPALIRQVIYNLLSNAVKFTAKRKKAVIEIGSTIEKEEFIFHVKDNGAGFDMSYYEKLFNVFQRLHSRSEFEGTGIGLPIAKRIIMLHGGRIWAEGKKGKGATFYFSLPVNPIP